MNVLDRIDATLDGLCPCGAPPRDGSAYCGPDCEPTHMSDDTDDRDAGPLATPMRWRPDLVTAADDSDLIPLGSETHGYTGRFHAQVFERASESTTWHLRLDDGHRFVGLDLSDVGGRQDPITEELVGRVREAWQRLERELADPRHAVPAPIGSGPWAGWTDMGYVDETEDPWADVMPATLSHGEAVLFVRPSSDGLRNELAAYSPAAPRARLFYHNPAARAVDVSADDLEGVGRWAQQSLRPLIAAAEAFLRDISVPLTQWQRQVVEQVYAAQVASPRRTGRSPMSGILPSHLWDTLPSDRVRVAARRAAAVSDEPPTDPMARALWLRKRRNTGPASDRLDGRRRRRR